MRIGVNTLFLVPGDVGGTEIYLRENLKEMIPANPQDSFVLFTSSDNDQSLKQDFGRCTNVEFVRLPFRAAARPLRIIAEQTMLPYYVRRQKIDVLWSPGYTAPLFCSCPQVVTIHDLQYKTHPEDLSLLERITLDFLVKNACRRCDSIIAVSKFSRSEIVRLGFAHEDKVRVVYEGVDPAFGTPTGADVSDLIDIQKGTPYILCVAHTYPHKHVHLLAQAYGKLMDEIPHHLVLVGKPRRGEQQLQDSLGQIGHTKRVHRVSELEYKELITLYQNADLFVLPSVYEGFGLPVLEALLAGVPVITTDKASLPEVGGEHVTYCTQTDIDSIAAEIREVVAESRESKESRIRNGKSWATSFNWSKSSRETRKLLVETGRL